MTTPNISVIVPIYNATNRIEASITSLLRQKNIALEIILVDDSSRDDSWKKIEILATKNKNIKTIRFNENRGVYQARLAGIKVAFSPWIGFLDADDIATEHMFEKLHTAAISQSVDVVICGSYQVSPERKRLRKRTSFKKNQRINQDIFSRFCNLEFGDGALWNKLYRAEILKNLPLDNIPWRQKINEDMITNIGVFQKARSIYLMKDMLHEYVVNPHSVTANNRNDSAYVDTFRAYAAALQIYKNFDDISLLNITQLYRNQLDSPPCRFDDIDFISTHHSEELTEATNLIIGIYSNGLGLLCCRPMKITNLPIKMLAKNLFKRTLLRLTDCVR